MEFIVDRNLSNKLLKKYNRILKKTSRLSSLIPSFFQPIAVPKKIQKEVSLTFPKKNYGKHIDEYAFEGCSLRSLLERSMFIGYELGKNSEKFKINNKKFTEIMKKLDKFDIEFEKGKRKYQGFNILKIEELDSDSCKITHQGLYQPQEKEIKISFKDAVKIYKTWEKQVNKL